VMRQVRSHRVVDGVNGSATHVCSAAGRQFDLIPVGNRPRRRDRRRATLGGAGAPDEYPSACRPFWRRPSTATSGTLAARRCSLAATWRVPERPGIPTALKTKPLRPIWTGLNCQPSGSIPVSATMFS
jgi:hypothetical protein